MFEIIRNNPAFGIANNARQYWYDIRSSYWFVPFLLILAAAGSAVSLIKAGEAINRLALGMLPDLFTVDMDSSRDLLIGITGAIMTVTGTVFSITLVALSLASTQYTSRVLHTFMRDRTNQVTLGLFIGIFTYCMIILVTIRGSEKDTPAASLTVSFGLLLSIASMLALVVFFHHISVSIQVSRILSSIYKETVEIIDQLYLPHSADEEFEEADTGADLHLFEKSWHVVKAARSGYVQQVDEGVLAAFARRNQALIRLERDIGDFLIEGAPMLTILSKEPPDKKQCFLLRSTFTAGRQRTIAQDPAFGIRELVDVAMKALSPGVNDTSTAVVCVDYLVALMVRLSDRRIRPLSQSKSGGVLIMRGGWTYASMLGEAFDQIRQNAAGNTAVLHRLLRGMEVLNGVVALESRRKALREQLQLITDLAPTIPSAHDRGKILQIASLAREKMELAKA